MRFRKKPVVIEAKQLTQSSMFEVLEWIRTNDGEAEPFNEDIALFIDTLEGIMRANEGDWIIRGVNGEFYPCKPDIFTTTYERADGMTEETTIWQDLRACKKEKFDADRARFLADAQAADDGGWTKHTQWHWSRMLNGERLDYWPSRKKYQYKGKVERGDVMKIVREAVKQ